MKNQSALVSFLRSARMRSALVEAHRNLAELYDTMAASAKRRAI